MKIFVLLPIIFGISLNLCAKASKPVTETNQIPIANAGQVVTIYLTQTSTATLDGSASSGDSFQWTEISTDYMSGATITSPNSKVTTVTGLPQGVFYFRLSVSSGGITATDSMKVIVDYAPIPKGASYTLGVPINQPAFDYMINRRDDTTHYLTYQSGYEQYWAYYYPDGTGNKLIYLERDRTNGMMIDSLKGKFYNTIENGYGGSTAPNGTRYARSQVNLRGLTIDTNKTYIINWKVYFSQKVSDYWYPSNPAWARVTMFDIHGNDDYSGQFGMVLARDSLCLSDGIFQPNGSLVYLQPKLLDPTVDMYNKANTVRITYREGAGYPGQKAFIKIEVNGVQKYFRNSGQVGKTPQFDYMKVTGLYDYSNRLVTPDSATFRRFSLVTEDASVYTLAAKPIVDAGLDKTVTSTSTSLSGTANDLGVSGQGIITSYQWAKLSGGTATITSPNSANTTITGLSNGTYQFQLKATDNSGIDGYDTVNVIVNALIGPQIVVSDTQTIREDSTLVTATVNWANGHSGTYDWTQVSGISTAVLDSNLSNQAYVKNLIPGTYTFRCFVTQDDGQTAYADAMVIVLAPNIPPTANAGNDQTITLPTDSIALSGSGKDEDGTVSSVHWTKISGPDSGTINNEDSASANITNLSEGNYQFEFTVTDNNGAFAKDTVQIIVNPAPNIPPTANAGNEQTITLPINSVALEGSGSDSDGMIASYLWTKISGPDSEEINNGNSAMALVSNLVQGIYQFELAVTDDKGAIGKDTVGITVIEAKNIAPTADAGSDQEFSLPKNSTILYGSGNDIDGTVSGYLWTKISGPATGLIEDTSSYFTNISGLSQGIYQFELSVIDDKGSVGKDTVTVTVDSSNNIAPIAEAGADQTITLPTNNVILSGNGIDTDGSVTGYEWKQISGPGNATMDNFQSSSVNISNLTQGIYQFELTVADDAGAFGKDTVEVLVNPAVNMAPQADGGNNQTITLPTNYITLNGSGSDSDGTVSGYFWEKISGPSGESMNNPDSASVNISDLVQGVYLFGLTVTDDKGAIGKDTVEVKVNAADNIAPTADAGINQTIVYPTDSVYLTGSGSDADGTISSYLWKKISGPSTDSIENSLSPFTKVSELSEGVYQFELTVTDDKGDVGKDTVLVIVNPGKNLAPVAYAGFDQTIKLPEDSVTLSGNGNDSDGTIKSYLWEKLSGPSSGYIEKPSSPSTKILGLSEGTYQFELTVKDDKSAVGKDTVEVTVDAADNKVPLANAGLDQTITLPRNGVILFGSGKDEDGTISAYSWTIVSGPAGSQIIYPNSASTLINQLVQGSYQFELTVTDDKGAVGRDTVKITVNPAPNIPPTAYAGSDKTITLPTNSVVLSGSGKDEDGTISAYSWTIVSGPAGLQIIYPNSASTLINQLVQGDYQFELTVTDDKGAVGRDTVKITVNPAPNIPPTAYAGSDKTITLPTNSVTLSGGGEDKDGTIASYQWIKISGPGSGTINNASSSSTSVSSLSEGTYQFALTVKDDKGAVGKDTMQVKVNPAPNIPPTANAGSDKTIALPTNSVTLSGNGQDKDGTIASYQWIKISGPGSGTINNASSSSTSVSSLSEGTYQFALTVTDDKGAVGKDTMQVKVNPAPNIPPTANAGSDKTITLPTNSVTLSGSGQDKDGTIASYQWIKISGPGSGIINNANSSSTSVSSLSEGTYQFALTVKDDKGAVGKDTMQVKVNPAPNIPPTANAGSDKTITLPTNSVTLSGSGQDKDGTIASYQWIKISGPGSETINNANSSSASASSLSEGIYQFELTVKDDKGAVGKDTMKITVNPAPNIPPSANAGSDTTILSPASTVILNGKGIDTNGQIVGYQWKQVSGPSESVINLSNTPAPEISELKEGTYEFEFLVTDNAGTEGKDTVKVTVALGRLAPEINTTITAYPNPVQNITTVDIHTGRPNTNILLTITDIFGKTIYKKEMISATDNLKEPINMTNFSKGTYIITIFFDNVLRKSIKVLKL